MVIVKADGLKPKSNLEKSGQTDSVKPRIDGGQWRYIRLLTSRITAIEASNEAMRLKLNRIERKVYRDEAKVEELPSSQSFDLLQDLNKPRHLSNDEIAILMRGGS